MQKRVSRPPLSCPIQRTVRRRPLPLHCRCPGRASRGLARTARDHEHAQRGRERCDNVQEGRLPAKITKNINHTSTGRHRQTGVPMQLKPKREHPSTPRKHDKTRQDKILQDKRWATSTTLRFEAYGHLTTTKACASDDITSLPHKGLFFLNTDGRPANVSYRAVCDLILRELEFAPHLCIHRLCDDFPRLLPEGGGLGSGVGRRRVGVAVARQDLLAQEVFDRLQRTPARGPVGIYKTKSRVTANSGIHGVTVVEDGQLMGMRSTGGIPLPQVHRRP